MQIIYTYTMLKHKNNIWFRRISISAAGISRYGNSMAANNTGSSVDRAHSLSHTQSMRSEGLFWGWVSLLYSHFSLPASFIINNYILKTVDQWLRGGTRKRRTPLEDPACPFGSKPAKSTDLFHRADLTH